MSEQTLSELLGRFNEVDTLVHEYERERNEILKSLALKTCPVEANKYFKVRVPLFHELTINHECRAAAKRGQTHLILDMKCVKVVPLTADTLRQRKSTRLYKIACRRVNSDRETLSKRLYYITDYIPEIINDDTTET